MAAARLRAVDDETRARIIEEVSQQMLTTVDIGGACLKFYALTPMLQWRAKTALTKEPDMMRWLDDLGPDAVFWDIGANVGVLSLY
ncbi:MAG: hypothetical protein AB7U61_10245, partial [Methylocystis sp.]